MQHATCMQVNHGNSQLLVVKSQIGTQTPSPSFSHNLFFKYSNGTCKPILNLYVIGAFQCYNEFFNPMNFDSYNYSLNFQESIGTPTPSGSQLGNVWVHSLTIFYIPESMKCGSRASFSIHTFTNFYLGCNPQHLIFSHVNVDMGWTHLERV